MQMVGSCLYTASLYSCLKINGRTRLWPNPQNNNQICSKLSVEIPAYTLVLYTLEPRWSKLIISPDVKPLGASRFMEEIGK